ncbi:MAG TPA: RNase adapter RapZ, partial [Paracoccaceae bacterium]|nr:RNase adapter RapZ [Paracoccaceae bacterium]
GMLLPAYRAEGKAYFTIAFGCTGGRHRSISVAEDLARHLAGRGWPVSIRHRELERRAGH